MFQIRHPFLTVVPVWKVKRQQKKRGVEVPSFPVFLKQTRPNSISLAQQAKCTHI